MSGTFFCFIEKERNVLFLYLILLLVMTLVFLNYHLNVLMT